MISFQQMVYIVALKESQSFSAAALKSFVTQPTLSMQIKKAEDVLGFIIFDRNSPSYNLTPKGLQLLAIIEQLLSDYKEIGYLVNSKNSIQQEHIKIGVIPTIANYLIEENYSQWKQLLGNSFVELEEMVTEDLIQKCEEKKLDAIILAGPINSQKLRTIPLFEEEMLIYTKHDSKNSSLTISEVMNWKPWLLSRGNCLRTQMMEFCSLSEDGKHAWNYQGGNIELLMRMVDKEAGYTLVPANFAHHLNRINEMKSIVNEYGESPARQIVCCIPIKSTKWNNIEKIIRHIQHQYGSTKLNKLKLMNWK